MESYSQRIDFNPHPFSRAFEFGESIKNQFGIAATNKPAVINRPAYLHAVNRTKPLDKFGASRSADRHLKAIGRQTEGSASVALCGGHDAGIAMEHRLQYFIFALASLRDDDAALAPSTHLSGGERKHRQRLFGGALANGQELLVDVKKDHHVGSVNAVKYRFGAYRHTMAQRFVTGRGDLVDRFTNERLELFTSSLHAHSEILECGGAAACAHHRPTFHPIWRAQLIINEMHQ